MSSINTIDVNQSACIRNIIQPTAGHNSIKKRWRLLNVSMRWHSSTEMCTSLRENIGLCVKHCVIDNYTYYITSIIDPAASVAYITETLYFWCEQHWNDGF